MDIERDIIDVLIPELLKTGIWEIPSRALKTSFDVSVPISDWYIEKRILLCRPNYSPTRFDKHHRAVYWIYYTKHSFHDTTTNKHAYFKRFYYTYTVDMYGTGFYSITKTEIIPLNDGKQLDACSEIELNLSYYMNRLTDGDYPFEDPLAGNLRIKHEIQSDDIKTILAL